MNNFQILKTSIALGILAAVSGCSEDPEVDPTGTPADVVVINEGNFSSGDGTFSTFNSVTGEVNLSVFASRNGFPVAASIQNAIVFDEKIFAVTNASDKIEVIDLETFESEAVIASGFSNPFSFAAIGDKGYVTNWGTFNNSTFLYENSFITIIDLSDYTVVDSIERAVQPQHVIAVGGFFYVSNVRENTVTVFDPTDDEVETDIDVSAGPDRMVIDSGDDIWLICNSGDMVKIDTETNTVEKTISGIQVAGFNERMVINDDRDQIYYLSSSGWPDYNTAIYSIGLDATTAPADPIVSGSNYYGVGISPDDILYIADANAFQGNGTVYRYDLEGTEIGQFNAGRGPNGFIFR